MDPELPGNTSAPTTINYDQYRFAGLPATYFNTAANDADGVTECILYGGMKEAICAQPDFPKAVPRALVPAHQIAPSVGAGLGMFATRAIRAHELIFAERPLLLMPAAFWPTQGRGFDRESMIAHSNEMLKCAIKRMTPANRAAYCALSNSHLRDGSPELFGILRTNGFSVGERLREVITQLPEGPMGMFTVIGKELSRINHSCSPNSHVDFDLCSLSLRVSAVRNIAEGEEITTMYCDLLDPCTTRRRTLSPYGFTCACEACQHRIDSDVRRRRIHASHHLWKDATFERWLRKPPQVDDQYKMQLLRLLRLIEEENLQLLQGYRNTRQKLAFVCAALGDKPNAIKYAKDVIGTRSPIRGVVPISAEKTLLNKAARSLIEPHLSKKVGARTHEMSRA
ncbi:hypothetical protein CERSUDRAFT_60284 [Gelatoporia subvermispora B]|uniref:SET domain-containing protein n=1 Tax=Ceriporiopsis subvermispora (strain B) TaxID=914234 RepID=M2P7C3_CERS8|nr:hypothetical protein CERSUDRAFT_60284 [Gelatoporia subvermispora B]